MLVIRSLDQLQSLAGTEVGRSEWHTVDQQRIDTFAAATGDSQWIHTDPVRAAAESPYAAPIAHGFLTLGLISALAAESFRIELGQTATINYGLNRVRFPGPVPVGSRIRARYSLRMAAPIPGGIQAVWDVEIERESSGKPALAAEWILNYYFGAQMGVA